MCVNQGCDIRGEGLPVHHELSFTDLLADPEARGAVAEAAASTGVRDGAARLAALIRSVAAEARSGAAPDDRGADQSADQEVK